MELRYKKGLECFIIFLAIPISYALPFNIGIKMAIGVLGFCYVLYVLFAVEKVSFRLSKDIHWLTFFKSTILKFTLLIIFTMSFVYFVMPENLFTVVKEKPRHWITFVGLYSIVSVIPQELLYRTFFFKRYSNLFTSNKQLFFVNAVIFSLGHLFFKNSIVLIITFIGGYIFCVTYSKSKSTFLVSLEHAIYGSWLFTVGMGQMLGFPV